MLSVGSGGDFFVFRRLTMNIVMPATRQITIAAEAAPAYRPIGIDASPSTFEVVVA